MAKRGLAHLGGDIDIYEIPIGFCGEVEMFLIGCKLVAVGERMSQRQFCGLIPDPHPPDKNIRSLTSSFPVMSLVYVRFVVVEFG